MDRFAGGIDLLLVESGGDNLAAHFSRELVDYSVYVIDVSGGDKIPRKGGPGTTQSDLLVINKTDLAEMVGADLGVMDRDAKKMRGEGPTVFCLHQGSGGTGGDCRAHSYGAGEGVAVGDAEVALTLFSLGLSLSCSYSCEIVANDR